MTTGEIDPKGISLIENFLDIIEDSESVFDEDDEEEQRDYFPSVSSDRYPLENEYACRYGCTYLLRMIMYACT